MKQKELYEKVAEELNMPVEKVVFVIKAYEQSLRWFISNPVYAGIRIFIPELMVFRIYEEKLLKKLTKFANKNPESLRVKYFTYFVRRYIDKEFMKDLVKIKWPFFKK